mmetsp:Transcript_4650/g.12381  ORF Transcript_4650/g.12381 Transcript_4650/m.12381 type:complete len:224 (-) Transcript_4650:107-778(-)|eukprot:CAMPEP_0115855484 /NCGR_PEP_ID=MMETSP0287-20121206/14564_1 /TAXON_ID=412157 /ORGANISM="Chrysochromulina rotalis, Strain UIO044" /LENGTH=223 /DNA_ID=CAMNT_0003309635 /DNA_START=30 /DNA_END=701 /DNA_ORIENTATION=-
MPFALADRLGWAPGSPAVAVLVTSCALGWILAAVVLASRPTVAGSRQTGLLPKNRLLVHSVVIGSVALVFWLWALEKYFHTGDRDLGVITFALAIFSSVEAFEFTVSSRPVAVRAVRCLRCLSIGSALGVAANYAYVWLLSPQLPGSFKRYLACGLGFWLLAAARACCLVRDDLVEQHGHDYATLAGMSSDAKANHWWQGLFGGRGPQEGLPPPTFSISEDEP